MRIPRLGPGNRNKAFAGALVALIIAGAAMYFVLRTPEPGGLDVIVLRSGGAPLAKARAIVRNQLRVTDSNGIAKFDRLDSGSQAVAVSAVGFGRVEKKVKIPSGGRSQVEFVLRDAQIKGRLIEQAAEPGAPTGVIIKLTTPTGEKQTARVHSDGTFQFPHAPVGRTTLEIDASVESNTLKQFDRYDIDTFPVQLAPGANDEKLVAPISAVETLVRWYSLQLDGRAGPLNRAARLYDHPDAAVYGCGVRTAAQADLAAHNSGTFPNDFTVLRAASIPSWSFVVDYEGTKRGHPGRFRRTYRDVVALTIQLSYATFSQDSATVHAVKHNGRWKGFPTCP